MEHIGFHPLAVYIEDTTAHTSDLIFLSFDPMLSTVLKEQVMKGSRLIV